MISFSCFVKKVSYTVNPHFLPYFPTCYWYKDFLAIYLVHRKHNLVSIHIYIFPCVLCFTYVIVGHKVENKWLLVKKSRTQEKNWTYAKIIRSKDRTCNRNYPAIRIWRLQAKNRTTLQDSCCTGCLYQRSSGWLG